MEMSFGVTGLMNILLSLVFIALSWWAIQGIRFDLLCSEFDDRRTKLLQIIVSIILGHGVARFFMDYLAWSSMLKQLF